MGTVPFLLNQLRPLDKGDAALTQAAASIALSNGQPQTIVDVLHGRAFRFYSRRHCVSTSRFANRLDRARRRTTSRSFARTSRRPNSND